MPRAISKEELVVPDFSNHFPDTWPSQEVSRKHRSNTLGVSGLGRVATYVLSDLTRALATIARSSGVSRHLDEFPQNSHDPRVEGYVLTLEALRTNRAMNPEVFSRFGSLTSRFTFSP